MEYLGCLIMSKYRVNKYLSSEKAEIPSFHRTDENWCDGTKVVSKGGLFCPLA